MPIIYPDYFALKDLALDVELYACVNGKLHDFMGRKTSNTSFFIENGVGFGITNIDIEVNPSLQPIVDITFKDLYGNTIFGTYRGSDKNAEIDTSVLFNWPPPKFIFAFKGFLGKKVKWILNLKSVDINFVASDSSYEIKCSFVPNQWGFFADIPFLYLVGLKKLRQDYYGVGIPAVSADCNKPSLENIFSNIKIGKQVEVKTQEKTKMFDDILNQMSAAKYDLSYAIFKDKTINLGEEITGVVENVKIRDFQPITFTLDGTGWTPDDAKTLMENKELSSQINACLLANMRAGTNPINGSVVITKDQVKDVVSSQVAAWKKTALSVIDANIKAINDEIQRRVYNSSKKQIAKLTISEIFRQLAKDTAFITGSILESGLRGYYSAKDTRKTDSENGIIIGRCFPLASIPKEGKTIEVPACEKYGFKNYKTDDPGNEMDFVRKFIVAIGEGISENLAGDNLGQDPDKLVKRINNLEILKGNPYKSYYANIVENILVRSGIGGFITRNSDPNYPGSYKGKGDGNRKADNPDAIADLAKADSENINDSILGAMSDDDTLKLKKFCTYWAKGFNEDGDSAIDYKGDDYSPQYLVAPNTYASIDIFKEMLPTEAMIQSFMENFKVIYLGDSPDEASLRAYKQYEKEGYVHENMVTVMDAGKHTVSFADIRREFLEAFTKREKNTSNNDGSEGLDEDENPNYTPNTEFIDLNLMVAKRVYNNGCYYFFPDYCKNLSLDPYLMIMFQGADVTNLNGINSAPSDSQITDEDKVETGGLWNSFNDPKGVILLNGWKTDDDERKIKTANQYIFGYAQGRSLVIDYSSVHAPEGSIEDYMWKIPISPDGIEGQVTIDIPGGNITFPTTSMKAENLAYTVYGEYNTSDGGFVFGPFLPNVSQGAINQRVYLKNICQAVLDKIEKREEKKREIIGLVVGKGSEQEDAIYKQMHNIFHQWESIAGVSGSGCGATIDDAKGLAKRLEIAYGCFHENVTSGEKAADLANKLKSKNSGQGNDIVSVFRYDYPLQSVQGEQVSVKDSIINIEALYKPNANTTVLNIIQQICTKNHFVFVPFPGDINYDNIKGLFSPYNFDRDVAPLNFFHVLFAPTPETRSVLSNENSVLMSDFKQYQKQITGEAIGIRYGGTDNQIFKNISVGIQGTRQTAESILNLQRLVDNENRDKAAFMDCSMLSVYEGRSYTANIDMLGNAQVYPMQYFFIENMPMFGGLYQSMKVKHNITPNDMSTTVEGIRMRFDINQKKYSGVPPITLQTLENLGPTLQPMAKQPQYDVQNVGKTPLLAPGQNNVMATPANTASESTVEAYIAGRLPSLNWSKSPTREPDVETTMKILSIIKANNYKIVIPSTGRVTSTHHRLDPAGNFHTGIDIGSANGSPVYAFMDGEVVYVYDKGLRNKEKGNSGVGNNVVIQHIVGPYVFYSWYNHLYSQAGHITVKLGDIVKAGTQIGKTGNSGHSFGPHLDFKLTLPKTGNVLDATRMLSGSNTPLTRADYLTAPNRVIVV